MSNYLEEIDLRHALEEHRLGRSGDLAKAAYLIADGLLDKWRVDERHRPDDRQEMALAVLHAATLYNSRKGSTSFNYMTCSAERKLMELWRTRRRRQKLFSNYIQGLNR